MAHPRSLFVPLLALALVLTACGGDDEPAAGGDATDSSVDGSAGTTDTGGGDDGTVIGGVTVELSGPVNDEGTAAVTGDSTAVDMVDFAYAPTFVTGSDGTVTIQLENVGDVPHSFTIESQGIDVVLSSGEAAETTVELPEDGQSLEFICRFHTSIGHRGAFVATSTGS